jgi:hypothetical protein
MAYATAVCPDSSAPFAPSEGAFTNRFIEIELVVAYLLSERLGGGDPGGGRIAALRVAVSV